MKPIYSKQAAKALSGMDKLTKQRIKQGITGIPKGDIKKLKGYSAAFRLRIGDYRIIFEMSSTELFIHAILPRGEAYKK